MLDELLLLPPKNLNPLPEEELPLLLPDDEKNDLEPPLLDPNELPPREPPDDELPPREPPPPPPPPLRPLTKFMATF